MRPIGTALVVALLAATLATAAHAGIDAGSTTGADTHFTPTPKDPPPKLLTQVAGAVYDESAPSKPKPLAGGSVTTHETDLFGVAFANEDAGFAVGAECPTEGRHAKDCPTDTVPVVYAYTGKQGEGEWAKADLRASGPGFASSVAWLDSERAIAVGGSGTYPERETPGANCAEGGDPDSDPAGEGRVWLYEKDKGWRQLEVTELPADLRALHAADAYIPLKGPKVEFAILGGLCQLWHWRDGGFQKQDDGSLDEPFSPTAEDPDRLIPELTYRLRDVRFGRPAHMSPALQSSDQQIEAVAVTAGCCKADEMERLEAEPATLTLTPPNDSNGNPDRARPLSQWTWKAEQAAQNSSVDPGSHVSAIATRVGTPAHYRQRSGCCPGTLDWFDPHPLRTSVISTALGPAPADEQQAALEPSSTIAGEQTAIATSLRLYDGDGDVAGGSIGSEQKVVRARTDFGLYPVLDWDTTVSAGMRETSVGQLVLPGCNVSSVCKNNLTTMWGHGFSTPVATSEEMTRDGVQPKIAPDGVPDWTVGELSGRGAIYTTLSAMAPEGAVKDPPALEGCEYSGFIPLGESLGAGADEMPERLPNWANCSGGELGTYPSGVADAYGKDLSPQNRIEPSTRSYRLLKSGTYALNAILVMDREAVGWMVGDRGAIVRLQLAEQRRDATAPESADQEPELPASAPPDQSLWPQPDGEDSAPTSVPPIDQADRTEAPTREMRMAATVRKAPTEMVMSRDGEEGWAFAGKEAYHFDGSAWRDCSLYEGDRACESFREVVTEDFSIDSATRVPLERDSDPANDDELEVAALTGQPIDESESPNVIVRYRQGRWVFDERDQTIRPNIIGTGGTGAVGQIPHDIAFLTPDEGWLVSRPTGNRSPTHIYLRFTFDGTSWKACQSVTGFGPAARLIDDCDPASRLPVRTCRHANPNSAPEGDAAARPVGEVLGLEAAGDRLYAYGYRSTDTSPIGTCQATTQTTPFVVFRERGDSAWHAEVRSGEYDPAWDASDGGGAIGSDVAQAATADQITGFMAHRRTDGVYEGWATGRFGSRRSARPFDLPLHDAHLLRLDPSGQWKLQRDAGALSDLPQQPPLTVSSSESMAMTQGPGGATRAYIAASKSHGGNLFELNNATGRWYAVPSGRPLSVGQVNLLSLPRGRIEATAPDGDGGLWASVDDTDGSGDRSYIFRVTDRPAREVFKETALPSQAPLELRAMATTPGGTAWAATDSDALYRYDRRVGWDRVRIPKWDAERVTVTSEANDIAIDRDGKGLVVGRGGRIASFSDQSVRLERASLRVCGALPARAPCTSAEDLRSVAVSADGAALIGANGARVLWRPAGGEIREIAGPEIKRDRSFVDATLAGEDLGWLVADDGRIYRGEREGGGWRWSDEGPAGVRALTLDERGRGYGVGDDGLISERSADGTWQRIAADTAEDLGAVAMLDGDPDSAVAGGPYGLILTRVGDRFEVARPADFPLDSHSQSAAVRTEVGSLILARGPGGRGVEAWAMRRPIAHGVRRPIGPRGTGRLYHYPGQGPVALAPAGARTEASPDAPAPREGEIVFGAFGKTGCLNRSSENPCVFEGVGMQGSNEYSDLLASRIVNELAGESKNREGLLTLFTGDAVDSAGYPGAQIQEGLAGRDHANAAVAHTHGMGSLKLRRFAEQVPDRLAELGIATFGTPGQSDVTAVGAREYFFTGDPVSTKNYLTAGDNLAWRRAMRAQLAPWGNARRGDAGGRYRYRSLRGLLQVGVPDFEAGGDGAVSKKEIATGGARTHYAFDVIDNQASGSESRVARVVVVDSSPRSLAAADPIQQPIEPYGGQSAWLERAICIADSPAARAKGCTRKPSQRAIVLSTTPTYTYGPGAEQTALDGAAVESILLANKADAFVSGRIGWNGLYWTTLPGVHHPCPGGSYPRSAPEGLEICGQGAPTGAADPSEALSLALSATSKGPAAELTGGGLEVGRPIPFVVASGGGGQLADEQGTASEGFWNGYSLIRLDPSGDPQKTIVEQRPIYDWVGIEAQERVLRPGQRMALRGFARGPIGLKFGHEVSAGPQPPVMRLDRIDSPAVTHRYELLEADPERPWLARRGPDGKPVALDPAVATVDDQSGQIRVGRGNHPRVYAVALLSVGKHSASYPLIFEPRRTFQPKATASPARTASVTVQSAQAGIAPPASPGTPPQVGSVSPPALPAFPSVTPPAATPPLGAPQPAPPPPAPPAPPPPAALELAPAPPGLTVAPPASVIPPPAPPINPAPPGGARKEARQRQAATEKSGSDAGAGSEIQQSGGDMADSPRNADGTSAMTRLDRAKVSPSFTTVAQPDQPSAWARGALYGGGLTLAALALASGFAGPRPRRREPIVPVPAHVRARRR